MRSYFGSTISFCALFFPLMIGKALAQQVVIADSVADWQAAAAFNPTDQPAEGHVDTDRSGRLFYGTYTTVSDPSTFAQFDHFQEDIGYNSALKHASPATAEEIWR